jgi:hypothetical protein
LVVDEGPERQPVEKTTRTLIRADPPKAEESNTQALCTEIRTGDRSSGRHPQIPRIIAKEMAKWVAGSNLAAVVPMLYSLYSLSPHVPNAESPPQKHNTISPPRLNEVGGPTS